MVKIRLDHAIAFLNDDELLTNFLTTVECLKAQLSNGADPIYLFGGRLDAVKAVSSLTLFEIATKKEIMRGGDSRETLVRANDLIESVLDLFLVHNLERCKITIQFLKSERRK
jgi:hypothetical protein